MFADEKYMKIAIRILIFMYLLVNLCRARILHNLFFGNLTGLIIYRIIFSVADQSKIHQMLSIPILKRMKRVFFVYVLHIIKNKNCVLKKLLIFFFFIFLFWSAIDGDWEDQLETDEHSRQPPPNPPSNSLFSGNKSADTMPNDAALQYYVTDFDTRPKTTPAPAKNSFW